MQIANVKERGDWYKVACSRNILLYKTFPAHLKAFTFSKMAWYYTLLIQDNNLEMLMAQTHIVPANPRACKRCLAGEGVMLLSVEF